MAIHLGPPVARRLLRPTRGLGSAPLPRRRSPVRGLRPPIWPCSGWSLPVSLRQPARAGRRHRHCGTGPRLAAGGRYPPPCAEELGLSSRPPGFPPPARDHPTASLTPSVYPTDLDTSIGTPAFAYIRGRTSTTAGPPVATRSIAWFASASATEFCARGTWVALHRSNPASVCRQAVQSGISFRSLTRQRPASCSTISFESRSSSTSRAPSSRARPRARSVPVYSATLLVWIPRYSEIDASGSARGSRASARRKSYSAAPSEAGPGLPRAAPSVRIRYPCR